VEEREGDKLKLHWKLKDGGAFPMPIEVRVGDRIERLDMADGKGELTLPAGELYTIDPHSRVLRQEAHIDEWQADEKERKKKAGRGA
jgi:hypothetical protein